MNWHWLINSDKYLNLKLSPLKMDSYFIKLDATHSHLKMRLAEIRFDLRSTIRQVKVSSDPIFIWLGNLRETIWFQCRHYEPWAQRWLRKFLSINEQWSGDLGTLRPSRELHHSCGRLSTIKLAGIAWGCESGWEVPNQRGGIQQARRHLPQVQVQDVADRPQFHEEERQ